MIGFIVGMIVGSFLGIIIGGMAVEISHSRKDRK